MYRLHEAAELGFARHETFHPRWGWFRKAVLAAAHDHDIFTEEDATVQLGVGKNMVRAIRFWGRAAKLLREDMNPERSRGSLVRPTNRGDALLGTGPGLDPYLELPGSLWVLHWWMLARPCVLPVWWLAFNVFNSVEFTADELFDAVQMELKRNPEWQNRLPVPASVRKDVDCLIRMYAPQTSKRLPIDDLLDCPFRELGLIEPVWDDGQRFRLVIGAKPTLPAAVVAYAAFDYMFDVEPAGRTATLSRLTTAAGGPGRAFKLTEDALLSALEEYAASEPRLRLTSAAGLPQISITADPADMARHAFWSHYADANSMINECDLRLDTEAAAPPAGGSHQLALVGGVRS